VVTASASSDLIVNRVRNHTEEGSILSIAKNSVIAQPIRLSRASGSLTSAEFSRFQIHLGEHAQATVILENTGDTHLAEDLEIILAPAQISPSFRYKSGIARAFTLQPIRRLSEEMQR
jgi:Fe-S cluster assembly protein SufD